MLAWAALPGIPMIWALASRRLGDSTGALRVKRAAMIGLASQAWLLTAQTLDPSYTELVLFEVGSNARMALLGGNAFVQVACAAVVHYSGTRGRWMLVAAHAASALFWGVLFAVQGGA